uniref:Uncharacterized protein n=1 Tax=Schlesneria paludicola TaxID=360056 RepID=A0A7C2NWN1_9PLAN
MIGECGLGVQAAIKPLELRGVVYREGEQGFAHCLELDIVAEGRDRIEAVNSVVDLCEFQIATALRNNDLESIFRPAPAQYWSLFYSATRRSRVPRRSGALQTF